MTASWLADLYRAPCPPRVVLPHETRTFEISAEAQSAQKEAQAEYAEAPVCPHCGIRKGFAPGTGDCGCGDNE